MAISEDQKRFRAGRIGSSDAARIMAGRWHELWLEKTGRVDPPNLDFVPAVQIGVATEHLHARFFTRHTGIGCYPADGESYVHPEHDFLVAHLDFLTWRERTGPFLDQPDTILEAKFCAGPMTDEDLAEQYFWQLQHQMLVSGLRNAVLSILRPGSYSWIGVPFDAARAAVLLETELAFWWHVQNDMQPGDPLPIEAPALDQARIYDMSLHNGFSAQAWTLLTNRPGMLAYRDAETELKGLMPDGARIAYVPASGAEGGLYLQRSKDGKVSLKFGVLPRKYHGKAEPWMPDFGVAEAAE